MTFQPHFVSLKHPCSSASPHSPLRFWTLSVDTVRHSAISAVVTSLRGLNLPRPPVRVAHVSLRLLPTPRRKAPSPLRICRLVALVIFAQLFCQMRDTRRAFVALAQVRHKVETRSTQVAYGTRCAVCGTEFWTLLRLREHLRKKALLSGGV